MGQPEGSRAGDTRRQRWTRTEQGIHSQLSVEAVGTMGKQREPAALASTCLLSPALCKGTGDSAVCGLPPAAACGRCLERMSCHKKPLLLDQPRPRPLLPEPKGRKCRRHGSFQSLLRLRTKKPGKGLGKEPGKNRLPR